MPRMTLKCLNLTTSTIFEHDSCGYESVGYSFGPKLGHSDLCFMVQ